MFKSIIEFLKKLVETDNIHNNLEAYIVAGNPQDPGDVDRLEREFYYKKQNPRGYNYF